MPRPRTSRRSPAPRRRATSPILEALEPRALLTTVSVNTGQVIRQVDTQLLGVNVDWWDSSLNTPQTQQLVQAAGLTIFRLPGGSASDDFHFNNPASYDGQGTAPSMASMIASVSGQAVVTLDYGSGSPREAAAFLAYFDAPVGNTTPIGNGQEWNDNTSQWQTVNWQTASYWANLRASAPLAQDDGLNFLRLDHPAPFNFTYFEVGNEEYGSWEIDHHTIQHDPATYIAFAKQFSQYASQIAPSISIGLDTGSPGTDDNNWIGNILQQSVNQGFLPGFLSDHSYMQGPGQESDSTLLFNTVTDPSSNLDWSVRAADYKALLSQYFGAQASDVELLATEFNSVYTNPGKQTTSLVNGLFVADSLGALLETPYDGALVWDLRNDYDTSNNNSSSLYGWRTGGDYGIIGSDGSAPNTGTNVPYPTYFAEQLASQIIQPGGQVLATQSDNLNLDAYAVLEPNGHLELLLINKSSTTSLTTTFQIPGFTPASQAQVWQYGETQDTAQSQSPTGQSALANFSTPIVLSGSSFTKSFPAYSMTVLDLSPSTSPTPTPSPSPSPTPTPTPTPAPTILHPASATPAAVSAQTTTLQALATDPAGASSLIYTWTTLGTLPAAVSFSTNGSNTASITTATFHAAGTYDFEVTVTDPAQLSVTSTVTVVVSQSLTSVVVIPASITLTPKASETFTAEALDQFGNPLAKQPAFLWSLSGKGKLTRTGQYKAPATAGTATVQARVGNIAGRAHIIIAPPRHKFVITRKNKHAFDVPSHVLQPLST